MQIPMTVEEVKKRGWEELDIILVTGDALVDHPSFGTSIIARVLESAGWRVGVISQPNWHNGEDISALGRPRLFFGVTSGNVDSMVANYTSSGKKRKSDDYTPGGSGGARPDRAVVVYSNLIRQVFKDTTIVLGGIEASLRRFSHYDWWSDTVKKSILLDSKADLLVYGMGEKPILEIAERIASTGEVPKDIRGTLYWTSRKPAGVEIQSHQSILSDRKKYMDAVKLLYEETDGHRGRTLYQLQDNRYVVQNPPPIITTEELDGYYDLPYTKKVHPLCLEKGPVKAFETIKNSITVHRGCYGQCNFCAITLHQGRTVISRSEASILREVDLLSESPEFKGTVTDLGGPTANMYGYECSLKAEAGACRDKRCLFPQVCRSLRVDHTRYTELLRKVSSRPGIKHVFVSSGIRYDLILADKKKGLIFLEQLIAHHVSGQLKIAPEHVSDKILTLMGKPSRESLESFLRAFNKFARGKNKFVIGYFIAAHPGCEIGDMLELKKFVRKELRYIPEQIQLFTPTPSTVSTAMYFTGLNVKNGAPVFVEKTQAGRLKQKSIITKGLTPNNKPRQHVNRARKERE